MPFTPSHTAAAVPFLRTRLVPSALVIGCMAPDFEYFLRMAADGGFGHRLPGIFLFDLPVSLAVLWLFHKFAKEPIYSWLPEGVRKRIRLGERSWPVHNFADFLLVALSIVVGTLTHIGWDFFTHRMFWPYRHWEFMRRTVQLPVYGSLEYLRVIQHVSTLAGAIVLLLWFRGWYRRTPPVEDAGTQGDSRVMLVIICVVALVTAIVRAFVTAGIPVDISTGKDFLGYSVITCITMLWVEVVVYGFYRAQ